MATLQGGATNHANHTRPSGSNGKAAPAAAAAPTPALVAAPGGASQPQLVAAVAVKVEEGKPANQGSSPKRQRTGSPTDARAAPISG